MDSVLGQRTCSRGSEIIENAYGRHSSIMNKDGGGGIGGIGGIGGGAMNGTSSETKPLISDEEWTKTNTSNSSSGYGSTTDTDTDNRGELGGGDANAASQVDDDGSFFAEIPAIIVTLMINFMTAIPFGVAYFPLGWSNNYGGSSSGGSGDDASGGDDQDGISGSFPLPGM
jgi:hypothetical protein